MSILRPTAQHAASGALHRCCRTAPAFCLALLLPATLAPGPTETVKQSAQASGGSTVQVYWADAPAAAADAATALNRADRWVPEIERMLFGVAAQRRRLIEVRLNGDARYGDPVRYRVPHVDYAGTVQLYQYGSTHLDALPHELVHAVLRREDVPYAFFDEEGLANYIAYQLRPALPGFPAYDHPLELVVGHWDSVGGRIPLTTLRARHGELNLKCSFQAYPVRASFFLYLGERFGSGTMRDFVTAMGREDAYESTFGAPLAELERDWLSDVRERFARLPERTALLESYLSQPAVRGAYTCTAGRDF